MPAPSTRRDLLKCAGALAAYAVVTLPVTPGEATPAEMQAAIKKVVGSNDIGKGRIKLDVPALVENGNTVPLAISVDSPMSATDYVRAIHVFNEGNPQPNVIGIHIGPRAGKAQVSTRIRLASTQRIVAIAEMSDGSFWSESANVIVTLAACLETQ